MADVNVLDLTPSTPSSDDSLILFDSTTGEAKSTGYTTLRDEVLDSKFDDTSPADGDVYQYDTTSGKWENSDTLTKEIKTRAKNGAHNLLPMSLSWIKSNNTAGSWSGNTYTISDIHFTVNSDLSISVTTESTGATAPINFTLCIKPSLISEAMTLTGCPSGGSNDTYSISYTNMVDTAYTDLGSGVNIPSPFNYSTYPNSRVVIIIKSGVIISSAKVFKPLIKLATDPSTTYTPYAPTNQQLAGVVPTMTANGAHNLLASYIESQVVNGVTITKYADGSFNCNGTVSLPTGTTHVDIPIVNERHNFSVTGDFIASGCNGGSTSTYLFNFKRNGSWGTTLMDGELFISGTVQGLVLRLYNGATISKTFYPMLRLATDTDPTYQPYAMTNRELTDATHALRTNATNRSLYSNNGTTFVSDSSITLSDNEWTLIEILMYTNSVNSGSRSVVLVYKNHIITGPFIPMINDSDRTKMAYFRPISYQNKVLSFQASCPVMIIDVRPII